MCLLFVPTDLSRKLHVTVLALIPETGPGFSSILPARIKS